MNARPALVTVGISPGARIVEREKREAGVAMRCI